MFDLYFGMFDLGSGARMGRPCYLVISAMGNRVTAVTVDCDFLVYRRMRWRSWLLRKPTLASVRLLKALPLLTVKLLVKSYLVAD
jgi:hypothetical protein